MSNAYQFIQDKLPKTCSPKKEFFMKEIKVFKAVKLSSQDPQEPPAAVQHTTIRKRLYKFDINGMNAKKRAVYFSTIIASGTRYTLLSLKQL